MVHLDTTQLDIVVTGLIIFGGKVIKQGIIHGVYLMAQWAGQAEVQDYIRGHFKRKKLHD